MITSSLHCTLSRLWDLISPTHNSACLLYFCSKLNMPALPSFQASLFFGAAFAHLAVVPKHLYVGSTLIKKTIESIPDRPDIATGKALIGTLWDYGNAFLIVTGKRLPAPNYLETRMLINSFKHFSTSNGRGTVHLSWLRISWLLRQPGWRDCTSECHTTRGPCIYQL